MITLADHVALAITNLRLRETLRSQAIRDPLTGLFNRRYMEETVARELRRVTRVDAPMAIMMMDLDHFKQFNDTFGHPAGDALLRRLGEVLQAQVRGSDIASRYGGEEFTLVLPDASLKDGQRRAEEIRKQVKGMKVEQGGRSLGPVSVSIGLACFPDHGETRDGLLQAADAALYLAKERGRDRVVIAERSR